MWNTFYLWRIQRRHKARFEKNLTKTKSWGRWVKSNTQKDFLVLLFIKKIKNILSSLFLLNILNDAMGWMRQGISYQNKLQLWSRFLCVTWHYIKVITSIILCETRNLPFMSPYIRHLSSSNEKSQGNTPHTLSILIRCTAQQRMTTFSHQRRRSCG